MKIEIIYEDKNIVIVDKPQNLLVHRAQKLHETDLLSELHHPDYAVITRLDYQTSGLVLLAKKPEIASMLNHLSIENKIRKFYRAVLIGYFEKPEAVETAYLLKDTEKAVVRIHDEPLPQSLKIMTKYQILQEESGMSLAEIELLTGRTHQIRAHMAFLGHPVVGDPLYGNQAFNRKTQMKTQALSASRIEFAPLDATHQLAYLSNQIFSIKHFPYDFLMKKAMTR